MEDFFALPYVRYSFITVVSLLVALVISKILRILIDRFIKLSSKKLKVDYTQFNFLKNAVTFFVFLAAIIFIFYSIPKLKALSITMFAGAGILTAIALFASQQAFANIVDKTICNFIDIGIPPVIVRVMGFGDSSVNLRAFVWSMDHSSGFVMKTDLNKTFKEQFDKHGIEIPFPYRTIVYKNK